METRKYPFSDAIKEVSVMSKIEKPPYDVKAHKVARVTEGDLEKIWSAALDSENQQMLAWVYLMQEILHIREILEQQKQSCDRGDCGCNNAYNGENK